MKRIWYVLMVVGLLALFTTTILAQPGPIGLSSEWEATGFNNGRRIVRDANGYFHAFWHSQVNFTAPPSATGCDIYYSYTLVPALEPPSMANQGSWASPVNLTAVLRNKDNRYPSVAIEYDTWGSGQWSNINTLHVVWQAIPPGGNRYEVLYAFVPVTSPPTPPPSWFAAINLSNTPADSLVPAIAINKYNPDNLNQHLHVVWQEEDANSGQSPPPPQEDFWFSEIFYTRSVNSGATWGVPVNLTRTPANSQMPSISCVLDEHTGIPHNLNDFGYNSDDVHVSYNENVGGAINVFYLRSPNDGLSWFPPVNISAATGGALGFDAYSNIAADMLDNPHIVFMRKNMVQMEPMRTCAPIYMPGINPSYPEAFPGPHIGMYGTMANVIVYAYHNGTNWIMRSWGGDDLEFPTVSLDRWQHVTVNWQQYSAKTTDYEIKRVFNLNGNAPALPPVLQSYIGWNVPVNDSNDLNKDDLFPNLAHKKVAMYQASIPGPGGPPPVPNEPQTAGFDEVWTKVSGHGPNAASAGVPKTVMQDGNMSYGP